MYNQWKNSLKMFLQAHRYKHGWICSDIEEDKDKHNYHCIMNMRFHMFAFGFILDSSHWSVKSSPYKNQVHQVLCMGMPMSLTQYKLCSEPRQLCTEHPEKIRWHGWIYYRKLQHKNWFSSTENPNKRLIVFMGRKCRVCGTCLSLVLFSI